MKFGNFGWAEMSYRKYEYKNNNDRMLEDYNIDYEYEEMYDWMEDVTFSDDDDIDKNTEE